MSLRRIAREPWWFAAEDPQPEPKRSQEWWAGYLYCLSEVRGIREDATSERQMLAVLRSRSEQELAAARKRLEQKERVFWALCAVVIVLIACSKFWT